MIDKNLCRSPDQRHSFPVTHGVCVNGCGVHQWELSYGSDPRVKQAPTSLKDMAARFQPAASRPKPRGIHSELHELIEGMIKQFGEPPEIMVRGRSTRTFAMYLGRLKHVPIDTIRGWLANIREGQNVRSPSRLFWWHYKQYQEKRSKLRATTDSQQRYTQDID